jgi:hypothetical protein
VSQPSSPSGSSSVVVAPHRLLEIGGIATFFALEVWLAAQVLTSVTTAGQMWLVAGALLAGYVGADFASGVIHWLFDRYGSVTTPVFGPNFITPFREHHVDPKGITRHDFVETNGNNCIATAPILGMALFLPVASSNAALFVAAGLGSLCLFVFATNQFHKWSHLDNPPAYVQLLQDAHLVLGRAHHDIHHTKPYDRYYCITTGWLNPLLTWIGFFPKVEAVIHAVSGVRGGDDDARTVEQRLGQ